MKDSKKENDQEMVEIQTTQDKIIPKFCTNINLGLIKNSNNVILSMAYSEEKGKASLIERIVIDLNHAKSLHGTLSKILEEVDNEE